MPTKQPKWKVIANLGDMQPLKYGGYFISVDETGVYPPEGELLEIDENDRPPYGTAYRFVLAPCTFIDGILSDNRFHPGMSAWFADSLDSMASFAGCTFENLVALFCSVDPLERAQAWQTVGEYHGFENLDSYALTLTKQETYRRYQFTINRLKGRKS